MALQSEGDELRAAWRALAGDDLKVGWRTIAVARGSVCRILAGRRFPSNEEAILFGFHTARLPSLADLPQGRGFEVCLANLKAEDGSIWVALCRQSAGSLELFEAMAADVISTLARLNGANERTILETLVERIRAWQDFMRRGTEATLGVEAELGLVGELEVLRELIAAGVDEAEAIDAWKGPLDAVHDFSLRGGAIEVKSTLSSAGFPARIASLEQLDDSRVHTLFLAGLRFRLDPQGMTLPELAQLISEQLTSQPPIEQAFNNLLLKAGLVRAFSGRYGRRFRRLEMHVFDVRGHFPRLTRAGTPREIMAVRYELDLDLIGGAGLGLVPALHKMGVT